MRHTRVIPSRRRLMILTMALQNRKIASPFCNKQHSQQEYYYYYSVRLAKSYLWWNRSLQLSNICNFGGNALVPLFFRIHNSMSVTCTSQLTIEFCIKPNVMLQFQTPHALVDLWQMKKTCTAYKWHDDCWQFLLVVSIYLLITCTVLWRNTVSSVMASPQVECSSQERPLSLSREANNVKNHAWWMF